MSETPSPAAPASVPADNAAPPRRTALAVIVLFAISIGLFLPSLKYRLVYDDHFLIMNNSSMTAVVDNFSNTFDLFGQEYWEGVNPERADVLKTRGQALYRPLTVFTWAVIFWATDGENDLSQTAEYPAFLYHLVSLLANALTVVMLFLALRSVTGSGLMAFVAALIFAVHPLHAEAVAYVAGLSDVFAALSIFSGLLFFQRATRSSERLGIGWLVAMFVTFFVGMLAKEGAVLLLAVVFLTDYVRSWRGRGLAMNQRLAVYLPLIAITLAMLAIRYAAVGSLQPDTSVISRIDNPLINEPFSIRLLNGFKLLGMQVWLFLWPEHLSIDYSYNVIKISKTVGDPAILASGILTIVAVLFGLIRAGRFPALSWGLLFFFGCAIFTSNILVPIGTIFGERLTYLPSAGAALCVAAVIHRVISSRRTGSLTPVGAVILLIIVGGLSYRTWQRQPDFQTTTTLFESAAEVVPESARVHYQLGSLYATQNLYGIAEKSYRQSLRIDNTFIQAGMQLANVLRNDKQYELAIAQYDNILRSMRGQDPTIVDEIRRMVLTDRAQAKLGMGDNEGATADLQLATNITGESVQSFSALARLLFTDQKFDEAIAAARRGLAIDSTNIDLLKLMGQAAALIGDEETREQTITMLEQTEAGRAVALALQAEQLYEEGDAEGDQQKITMALNMFDEARKLDEELAVPLIYRGRFFAEQGRYFDAITDLDRALQKVPGHPVALSYKARAQIGARRLDDALETLLLLVTVRPTAEAYRQLATIYAQLGKHDELEGTYAKLEELGESAAEVIFEQALAYVDQGNLDQGILTLEQGLAVPDYVNNPLLTRALAICYLDAARYEEALATFQLQADIASTLPESSDPYIPLNMARSLMGLDRDLEAASQLEIFEQMIDKESPAGVSLLHRRSQLLLKRDGPFYNAQEAAVLADEMLTRTQNQHSPYFFVAIEAHAAAGDLSSALLRSEEAQLTFFNDPAYPALVDALGTAIAGDVNTAATALRATERPELIRIAEALEG